MLYGRGNRVGKFIGVLAASASMAVLLTACGGSSSSSSATTPSPTATPYVATESGFSAVFPATPAKQTQKITQSGLNLDLTL